MCYSYTNLHSTERALLLRLLFSLLANQIVQTSELEMLPKAENDEQVIEQGSTLTLACIVDESTKSFEIKWTVPRITQNKEVISKFHFYHLFS
jgi:hypothetical protein